MAYTRRKFKNLAEAVASVKCASQKLVKLRKWCARKGLDLVIKRLQLDMALIMAFNKGF